MLPFPFYSSYSERYEVKDFAQRVLYVLNWFVNQSYCLLNTAPVADER